MPANRSPFKHLVQIKCYQPSIKLQIPTSRVAIYIPVRWERRYFIRLQMCDLLAENRFNEVAVTFGHQNRIGSSLNATGRLCQIWKKINKSTHSDQARNNRHQRYRLWMEGFLAVTNQWPQTDIQGQQEWDWCSTVLVQAKTELDERYSSSREQSFIVKSFLPNTLFIIQQHISELAFKCFQMFFGNLKCFVPRPFFCLLAGETKHSSKYSTPSEKLCYGNSPHHRVASKAWKARLLDSIYIFRCLSAASVGCPILVSLPTALCIAGVAVVGLSKAFKHSVFPLLLVPCGGTGSRCETRRCTARRSGGAPQIPHTHTFHLTHRIERTESGQLPGSSLYTLQSWPALLCCTPKAVSGPSWR